MPKAKQVVFCRRLNLGITRLNGAITQLRAARNVAPTLAIRRRLNQNINTLLTVRADKRQLRNQRCR